MEEVICFLLSELVQEGGPLPIAKLESVGINAATIKKLQEAGYYTVESVMTAILSNVKVAFSTMKKLVDVKGISEVNAQKIQQAASKLIPMGFTTVQPICRPHSSGNRI